MARLSTDAQLEKISAWLAQAYGPRLLSLVVYGSAAGGNHHGLHSDINLLAIFDRIDAALLDQGAEAMRWWAQQGNPPATMLSRAELENSADLFPVEFLDIRRHHRLLRGEELLEAGTHDPESHRRQVEHDLRAQLLRLRGRYLLVARDAKLLERLLLRSSSTFLTLFRHALVAVHEPFQVNKQEVLRAAAARFEFSPDAFQAILDARHSGGRLAGGKLDALRRLFADYLQGIQQVERILEA